MKTFLPILFLCLIVVGCTSPSKLLCTMNETLLGDRLGFTIEDVRASQQVRRGRRNSLHLDIYVRRCPEDYRRDFALELQTAGVVLAALAKNQEAARYEHMILMIINRYGLIPGSRKPLEGSLSGHMAQRTLLELRDRNASPAEYARALDFVDGFKVQPDTQELLILH
jgi:hypothetical protein